MSPTKPEWMKDDLNDVIGTSGWSLSAITPTLVLKWASVAFVVALYVLWVIAAVLALFGVFG